MEDKVFFKLKSTAELKLLNEDSISEILQICSQNTTECTEENLFNRI